MLDSNPCAGQLWRAVPRCPFVFRRIVPALTVAGALLAPERAGACGAVPRPDYAIAELSPSAGSTAVARDAGIIITGMPSSPSGGPSVFADVELIDTDTQEPVPLISVAWFALQGPHETLAFRPVEPLVARHAYRIEARPFDATDGMPGEAVVSEFVTSDALLAPVALSGELELSLRGADMDIVDCGPCGESCTVIGSQRVLMADVQLPVPSGGQGMYQAALHFTDRTPTRLDTRDPLDYETWDPEPHVFHTMQFADIQAGQASTLEQMVFDEGLPYAGCFTFVVWDPGGRGAQTSRCLPSLSPDDLRALARDEQPLEVAADEAVAAADVQRAAADRRDERAPVFACSFGPAVSSAAPAWLTLLLASSLVRRIARRR